MLEVSQFELHLSEIARLGCCRMHHIPNDITSFHVYEHALLASNDGIFEVNGRLAV